MLNHYIIQTDYSTRFELDAERLNLEDGYVIFFAEDRVVGLFYHPIAVICTPIAN